MIQAVIFDMDGLLTDSESIGLQVIEECTKKQGVPVPPSLIKQTLGMTSPNACQIYHQHYPALDTVQLFHDFWIDMHALAEEGKIPLKKGARELLAWCREKDLPMAVASSSRLETVQLYLGKAGVLPFFDALITGCPEIPSKPAPDIFLKAAKALSAKPENCLVLEDSINGVKAGRAAGMQVCMIPDMIPYSAALAPFVDWVLSDLSKVRGLMEE